jgi:hypothetical protein
MKSTKHQNISLHHLQNSGVLPEQSGQVVDINADCLKVREYSSGVLRGVTTGLLLAILNCCFCLDLAVDPAFSSGHGATIEFLEWAGNQGIWIFLVVVLDIFLLPMKPPVVFDRKNRIVIFRSCLSTQIITWDNCSCAIKYYSNNIDGVTNEGYILYLQGYDANHPADNAKQSLKIISILGSAHDHLRLWEYIRCFMECGPEAVPAPNAFVDEGAVRTSLRYYQELIMVRELCIAICHPQSLGRFLEGLIMAFVSISFLAMAPLLYPPFFMHALSKRIALRCRYPKAVRQLCNQDTSMPTRIQPDKLVIHIDGKPLEVDWPSEAWKQPPSNGQPPE